MEKTQKKLVSPGTWGSLQAVPVSRQRVMALIESGRLPAVWVKSKAGRIGCWKIDPAQTVKRLKPWETSKESEAKNG